MNYENLKALVNAKVYENTEQGITGEGLNEVLQSIVTSLKKGYLFVGIATPSTNPGTPDQNVFYIAGPGTYPNFNSAIIPDGRLGVMKYNGAWSLETVVVGKDYDTVLSTLGLYNIRDSIAYTTGHYWTYSGSLASGSAWQYSGPISVSRGTIIVVPDTVTSVGVIVEVDSGNNYISTLRRGTDSGDGTDSSGNTYYIASRDCYISISLLTSKQGQVIISNSGLVDSLLADIDAVSEDINTEIDTIIESIGIEETPIASGDIINGAYRVVAIPVGKIVSHSAYSYTKPIAVQAGDLIVTNRAISVINVVALITQVDENGTPISLIQRATGTSTKYAVEIPISGYVSLSALKSQMDAFEIITRPVQRAIYELQNSIGDISDLSQYIGNGKISVSSSITVTGKYRVATDGQIVTLNGYSYTNPIQVHNGDLVFIPNASIVTSVAFITRVDSSGNVVSVFKAGEGSPARDYSIRIDFNGYISISCLKSIITNAYVLNSTLIASLFANVAFLDGDSGLTALSDNPLQVILREAGYGGIIHKWGIIGDSLASGEMQCYNENSTSASDYKFADMYQWSWGQRMARLLGVDCYNFSNGGQTTKGWLTAQGTVHDETYVGGVGGGDWRLAQQSAYLKDGYIIALAVNDRSKSYGVGDVSTDIDDSDYNNNAETYVGYYAGIIQRLKSVQPTCKIFCVTAPSATYDSYNAAIRNIVNHFAAIYPKDIFCIDLRLYMPIPAGQTTPTGGLNSGYHLNGHLSPAGYQYTAWVMNTYIDWIIRHNGEKFKGTAIIGTNYREEY